MDILTFLAIIICVSPIHISLIICCYKFNKYEKYMGKELIKELSNDSSTLNLPIVDKQHLSYTINNLKEISLVKSLFDFIQHSS